MNKVYGYARVSTKTQELQRQIDNIKRIDESAIIITEQFTGTTQDRPQWNRLKSLVKNGDTIIFDEVSRMSRTSEDGYREYRELFDKGVNLVFNKERYLDTDCFREALNKSVELTGHDIDCILKGVNEYLLLVAEKQIKLAFDKAQSEAEYIRQRTREGIEVARLNGKQIGQAQGKTLNVKKQNESLETIKKHSKDFDGTLSDNEVIKLCGISRNSFYKYKRMIRETI